MSTLNQNHQEVAGGGQEVAVEYLLLPFGIKRRPKIWFVWRKIWIVATTFGLVLVFAQQPITTNGQASFVHELQKQAKEHKNQFC